MAQNVLKDQGWNLNLASIPGLNPNANANDVLKRAVDLDLRQIVDTSRPATDTKSKTSLLGPLVVQLQKSLNIGVPKDQSEISIQGNSRRLLLLTLTDGSASYQAVEMQPINGLTMDTPPGTKLQLIGDISIWKGFLQLYPNNVKILGGKVEKLVSSWELNRQLGSRAAAMLKSQTQRQITGPGGHGPPAFVPFGQRIVNKYDPASTNNFKAMDVVGKDKSSFDEEEDGNEFSEQRQAAIAKALKDGKKKQTSSEEPAQLAMPDISQLSIAPKPAPPPPKPAPAPVVSAGPDGDDPPRGRFGGRGRGRRGRANYEDDFEAAASLGRPSQFNLFDIIQQQPGQEKLKLFADTAKAMAESEKNSSSSSSAREGGYHGGRGGRGGHRGGSARGGWRGGGGRGGGGSARVGSRSGYQNSGQVFREGSVSQSSRVDSVSPTSDGGTRGGTGNRDLPPRLKRTQQNSMSQSWADDSDGFAVLHGSKSRSSTDQADIEIDQSSRKSSTLQNAMPPSIIYSVSDGGAFSADGAPLFALPSSAGFAIHSPLYATAPAFVPSAPASAAATASSSSSQIDWRPGAFCMSRWADGGLYPAQIVSIDAPTQSCVVNYYQYNECQTVPLSTLHQIPIESSALSALSPVQHAVVFLPSPALGAPPQIPVQSPNQQRMMWVNGSPLLPPPPPFPGIESFANRLSFPSLPFDGSIPPGMVASHMPVIHLSAHSSTSSSSRDKRSGKKHQNKAQNHQQQPDCNDKEPEQLSNGVESEAVAAD